jgi:hypothetical protein
MPYAEGRTYYDADSHLMELSDWLVQYADPSVRDRIRPLAPAAPANLRTRRCATRNSAAVTWRPPPHSKRT